MKEVNEADRLGLAEGMLSTSITNILLYELRWFIMLMVSEHPSLNNAECY